MGETPKPLATRRGECPPTMGNSSSRWKESTAGTAVPQGLPYPLTTAFTFSVVGFSMMPFSVTIPAMFSAGVTSKAGE